MFPLLTHSCLPYGHDGVVSETWELSGGCCQPACGSVLGGPAERILADSAVWAWVHCPWAQAELHWVGLQPPWGLGCPQSSQRLPSPQSSTCTPTAGTFSKSRWRSCGRREAAATALGFPAAAVCLLPHIRAVQADFWLCSVRVLKCVYVGSPDVIILEGHMALCFKNRDLFLFFCICS